jgi:PGF-CTERM protein
MNRVHTPDWVPTRRLATTVAVVFCLGVLLAAASGAVAGQDVNVSIQPSDGEVEADGERTFEVVVEGAGEGIGVHDIELNLTDGDVAEMTSIEFVKDPLPVQNQAEVRDGGTTAVGVAAMGDNTYDAADEIAILEVTVRGKTLNESTELTVAGAPQIGNPNGNEYNVSGVTGVTISVVEEVTADDSGDGSGPGFGIAAALAALAGAGYLRRRTAGGR